MHLPQPGAVGCIIVSPSASPAVIVSTKGSAQCISHRHSVVGCVWPCGMRLLQAILLVAQGPAKSNSRCWWCISYIYLYGHLKTVQGQLAPSIRQRRCLPVPPSHTSGCQESGFCGINEPCSSMSSYLQRECGILVCPVCGIPARPECGTPYLARIAVQQRVPVIAYSAKSSLPACFRSSAVYSVDKAQGIAAQDTTPFAMNHPVNVMACMLLFFCRFQSGRHRTLQRIHRSAFALSSLQKPLLFFLLTYSLLVYLSLSSATFNVDMEVTDGSVTILTNIPCLHACALLPRTVLTENTRQHGTAQAVANEATDGSMSILTGMPCLLTLVLPFCVGMAQGIAAQDTAPSSFFKNHPLKIMACML
eukprot:scaffold199467_cov20-Tisochrysis_lutea.AAC.1